MKRQRRRFGAWELYTSRPITLGCKPYLNDSVYHVKLEDCQTEEGYQEWVKQISEKVDFDVAGFKLAIQTLRAEGKYLKTVGVMVMMVLSRLGLST
jgi:hypothetical protein